MPHVYPVKFSRGDHFTGAPRLTFRRPSMIRRTFLALIAILGVSFAALLYFDSSLIRRLYYRLEGLFMKPVQLPPDSERLVAELPAGGDTVSVEMALNSRCTSDYDGNPKRFHWGMFDETRKLSDEQITKIVTYASIPRFTSQKVEIQPDRNILTLVVDNHISSIEREWMMVESGMQQQAIGLVCAALGVGMVFRNLGKDGTTMSKSQHANIKIKLDPMRSTYNGSHWTASSPKGLRGWLKGNIPDPARQGGTPLISALRDLKTKNTNGRTATEADLSQLLWAARGRTPHYYKSRPWGMTIPTWAGEQNISSVYLVSDNKMSKYLNWQSRRPTHSVSGINKIDKKLMEEFRKHISPYSRFIILGKNEEFSRALWEIGFQLLNLLLQAHSIGLTYRALLLNEPMKNILTEMGIKYPIAILAI